MEKLDMVNPLLLEIFGDRELAKYYELFVASVFIALFWLYSFVLFFGVIKAFRNSEAVVHKIISIVMVVWCVAMWTSSSIVIFQEFQKPALSAGFVIGFVIGTLFLLPALIANQQTSDAEVNSKTSVFKISQEPKPLIPEIQNEKVKLKSNFYNAISLALIGTALITPISNLFTQPSQNPFNMATIILIVFGFSFAILFHLLARRALDGLVKETKTTKKTRQSAI